MLFIPLEKNIDWKKPPVFTIIIILVNIICYFGFQLDDDEKFNDAANYYFKSGLSDIELPYYSQYLSGKGSIFSSFINSGEDKVQPVAKGKQYTLFSQMLNDGRFLERLSSGEIIKPGNEDYLKWKKLSGEFTRKLNNVTYFKYGLKAYNPTITTLFTSMFLHANFEHLFWNMVFLFVFGFSVEMILGAGIYVPTYLLAGIGSGLFFSIIESNSAIPGIGASGAIAGLAGMYTVLYGLRKIRFFYFVFVYFDTVKAPALIILPLWLGYELYNHFFIPSNINNLAHAGGLICGALIAWLAKTFYRNLNDAYLDENANKENFDNVFATAMSEMAALNTDKARGHFLQLYKEYPGNIDVLKQLFILSKFNPASQDFHDYAMKIMTFPENNAHINNVVLEVYKEYVDKAKPGPKFTPDFMVSLSLRFLKSGFLQEAEKIIVFLLNKKIKHKNLIESLQLLANQYRKSDMQKSLKYQALIDKVTA